MQVAKVDVKVDEMNLYDYVMNTFERICDLTEGRVMSLNFVLNNVNAKCVNVALFKSFFEVVSFDDMMRLLTDFERFDELHDFGVMCLEDHEKEQASIVPSGMKLAKTPIQN
jgi:hypothetical protein